MNSHRQALRSIVIICSNSTGLLGVVYVLYSLLIFNDVISSVLGAPGLFGNAVGGVNYGFFNVIFVCFIFPVTLLLAVIISSSGMLLSDVIDRLLKKSQSRVNVITTESQVDFTQYQTAKTYRQSLGSQSAPVLTDERKRSLFLSGSSYDIVAVASYTFSSQTISWFRTDSDVLIIDFTDKTFPHCYIKSKLNRAADDLMDGAIAGTVPITLEAEFGDYYTVYAAQSDQVAVRVVLTPDVMLKILESLPTANIELLNGSMYLQLAAAHTYSEAAGHVASLQQIISELLEQRLVGLNAIAQRFTERNKWLNPKYVAGQTASLAFKLFGWAFLFLMVGLLLSYIPKVGDAIFKGFAIISLLPFVGCTVLFVVTFYGYILYQIFNFPRLTVVTLRMRSLAKSYERNY